MISNIKIKIQRLDKELPLPEYALEGDAGLDIYSRINTVIKPGERISIPTGIAFALPDGFVALVHPRSGLALKNGISIVNSPGTIDSGYRGEINVILINTDTKEPFEVKKGQRIAQIVFQKYEHAHLEEVEFLPKTARGSGGFGSTGG